MMRLKNFLEEQTIPELFRLNLIELIIRSFQVRCCLDMNIQRESTDYDAWWTNLLVPSCSSQQQIKFTVLRCI